MDWPLFWAAAGVISAFLFALIGLILNGFSSTKKQIAVVGNRVQELDNRMHDLDKRVTIIETRIGFIERLLEMSSSRGEQFSKRKEKE